MAEWLKAHAWKACVPQGTVGSNPTLSASHFPLKSYISVANPHHPKKNCHPEHLTSLAAS
jgi:hypothetical protein